MDETTPGALPDRWLGLDPFDWLEIQVRWMRVLYEALQSDVDALAVRVRELEAARDLEN